MIDPDVRDRIIAEPEVLLEDRDVMAALIAANERAMGANVIDLRGIAMERMGARLDRLEDTHRSVIAAAYENLAGTNQIHRAILALLDQTAFDGFLKVLAGEVAGILRVDCLRLVLETAARDQAPPLDRLSDALVLVDPGFIEGYIAAGRSTPFRTVTLRQTLPGEDGFYGERAAWIRSEALLRLDLGRGRLPAMLALGAEDPHLFRPTQGTDLLAFFAGVFERAMRRWLG